MYTHVMLIWLINAYWMLPLAWQKHWVIEALPSKIYISFLPSMLIRNPWFLRLLTYNRKYKKWVLSFDKLYHPFHFMFDCIYIYIYINIYNIYIIYIYNIYIYIYIYIQQIFERYFFYHWTWLNMFMKW